MQYAGPFSAPGQWYKGNLHTHTTQSDGKLDPLTTVQRYRAADYDFLALTDHDRITPTADLSGEGILLLLGVETSAKRHEIADEAHVVAFGLQKPGGLPRSAGVQAVIDWAREHGGEAIIGHPYYSGMDARELAEWDNYLGVEIFNTGCHFLGRGYSTVHWDGLLSRGRSVWGFATDDAHHTIEEDQPMDTAQAWIMVKAPELTREALLASMRRGLFYSSWGPDIYEVSMSDGVIRARTSPAKVISFVTDSWWGHSSFAMDGGTRTEAIYRPEGTERFVRVECHDADGRSAWSNPVFLRDASFAS